MLIDKVKRLMNKVTKYYSNSPNKLFELDQSDVKQIQTFVMIFQKNEM